MMNIETIKDTRILYVEDEQQVREGVSRMLSSIFNGVITAENGLDGLTKFKDSLEDSSSQIDMIITDINMPKMNGLKMIEEIRQLDHLIPIVIVSAYSDNDFLKQSIDLGVNGYAIKPIDLQVLVNTLIQAYEATYLRKTLEAKVEERTNQIRSILDLQDNIVLLTDGKKLRFANQKFFTFLGFESLDHFLKKHECICEYFIENDRFFHLGKIDEDENWLEVMDSLLHSDRIVSILGSDFVIHAFSVTINQFDDEVQIVTFTDISQTMLEHIQLEDKVIHDKLTGAFNREFFEQNYEKLLNDYHTSNTNLAIALLDIDHFKDVNDTYGHDVGDEVLIELVKTIEKYLRKDDIIVRWGGEEFIIVLKVSSSEDLFKALEHTRKVIEIKKFPVVGKKTCSIGGSIYKDSEDIKQTIKRADEAVYEAKNSGRNKVIIH